MGLRSIAERTKPRQVTTFERSTHRALNDHDERLAKVETAVISIGEFTSSINTFTGKVKKYGLIVATALVASGLLNGRFGDFVAAVVKGFSG